MLEQNKLYDWVKAQNFDNEASFNEVAGELDFLQNVICPMYYEKIISYDVPYVIGEHYNWVDTGKASKYKAPIYLIENENVKIVFLVNSNHIFHTLIWEVSFFIKNNSFCDEKIIAFRDWYRKYYKKYRRGFKTFNVSIEELPKVYRYNSLNLCSDLSKKEENFTISFEGEDAKFIFFEFMNHFREF